MTRSLAELLAHTDNGHTDGVYRRRLPNRPSQLGPFLAEIDQELQKLDFDKQRRTAVRLVLEEALINAMKHGNRFSPHKAVDVAYCFSPECFQVHIRDEGEGYDPEFLPDPLAPENLERPNGRGMLLVRHYVDEYELHPPGNAITLTWWRNPRDS